MTKVFVAYSRRNRRRVLRFVDELESISPMIEIWFGERDLVPGEDVENTVRRALEAANVLVFCASKATSPNNVGVLLADETHDAMRRLRSDPNFKVVNVVLDKRGYVPRGLLEHPTIDLSLGQNWRRSVQAVANTILAD